MSKRARVGVGAEASGSRNKSEMSKRARVGVGVEASGSRNKSVNMAKNFVGDLHAFLNGNPRGVTWAHNGNGFHLDVSKVSLDVFQWHFQRSIAGFQSELMRWGFGVESIHYRHRDDLFLRGQPELVDGIVRDPSPPASPPATASPQPVAAAVLLQLLPLQQCHSLFYHFGGANPSEVQKFHEQKHGDGHLFNRLLLLHQVGEFAWPGPQDMRSLRPHVSDVVMALSCSI